MSILLCIGFIGDSFLKEPTIITTPKYFTFPHFFFETKYFSYLNSIKVTLTEFKTKVFSI